MMNSTISSARGYMGGCGGGGSVHGDTDDRFLKGGISIHERLGGTKYIGNAGGDGVVGSDWSIGGGGAGSKGFSANGNYDGGYGITNNYFDGTDISYAGGGGGTTGTGGSGGGGNGGTLSAAPTNGEDGKGGGGGAYEGSTYTAGDGGDGVAIFRLSTITCLLYTSPSPRD